MKRISTAALTDHNRSCVPCALSVILNKPYEEVNNWLKYRGYRRSDNRGTYTDRMRLSELNLIKMSIDPISVNRFVEKYSQGTYFVLVRQHGLAVKNGICYDTIISEKKRVQEAYELQGGVRLPHDWDSDTRMEKRSNFEFCHCANGRVLIAGLGIGLILHNITHRINEGIITSVVIVEKSQDVIDLIKPYFDDISTKVEFVCCDIFEYKPDGKFDTIYFDIWPDICESNLDQIKKLHNKFKHKLNRHNPDCWMNSWMKDYLQSQKRRNRSRY